MNEKLTLEQLRYITLEAQGLTSSSSFGLGKDAVLNTIEHIGYLQIDTISVIERAHHHTLWTRVPDYHPSYLEDLVQERKIFEYWFHAASYLPIRDFRFALPQMQKIKKDKKHYYKAEPKVMQYVLDAIREEGPKRARDFENKSTINGTWWEWKPAKVALERLFLQGDIMISKREGIQKTFDLTERVLPSTINMTMPTPLEEAEHLTRTYLKAYGFTTINQIMHLKTGTTIKNNIIKVLNKMCEEGTITPLAVEGLPTMYVLNDLFNKVIHPTNNTMALLSPFDNLIIHRDRLQHLFDYNFRLECYLPKEKRQYGYFCLPILFGQTFIGRVDCKVHRKEKHLELVHLHIENTEINIETWITPFRELIRRFSQFNNCDTITITKISPNYLSSHINAL